MNFTWDKSQERRGYRTFGTDKSHCIFSLRLLFISVVLISIKALMALPSTPRLYRISKKKFCLLK